MPTRMGAMRGAQQLLPLLSLALLLGAASVTALSIHCGCNMKEMLPCSDYAGRGEALCEVSGMGTASVARHA